MRPKWHAPAKAPTAMRAMRHLSTALLPSPSCSNRRTAVERYTRCGSTGSAPGGVEASLACRGATPGVCTLPLLGCARSSLSELHCQCRGQLAQVVCGQQVAHVYLDVWSPASCITWAVFTLVSCHPPCALALQRMRGRGEQSRVACTSEHGLCGAWAELGRASKQRTCATALGNSTSGYNKRGTHKTRH